MCCSPNNGRFRLGERDESEVGISIDAGAGASAGAGSGAGGGAGADGGVNGDDYDGGCSGGGDASDGGGTAAAAGSDVAGGDLGGETTTSDEGTTLASDGATAPTPTGRRADPPAICWFWSACVTNEGKACATLQFIVPTRIPTLDAAIAKCSTLGEMLETVCLAGAGAGNADTARQAALHRTFGVHGGPAPSLYGAPTADPKKQTGGGGKAKGQGKGRGGGGGGGSADGSGGGNSTVGASSNACAGCDAAAPLFTKTQWKRRFTTGRCRDCVAKRIAVIL